LKYFAQDTTGYHTHGCHDARHGWHGSHATLEGHPAFRQTPVIMITGKSEGNVVIDSLKAGASDFRGETIRPCHAVGQDSACVKGDSSAVAFFVGGQYGLQLAISGG